MVSNHIDVGDVGVGQYRGHIDVGNVGVGRYRGHVGVGDISIPTIEVISKNIDPKKCVRATYKIWQDSYLAAYNTEGTAVMLSRIARGQLQLPERAASC